jgi:hypothetical protein
MREADWSLFVDDLGFSTKCCPKRVQYALFQEYSRELEDYPPPDHPDDPPPCVDAEGAPVTPRGMLQCHFLGALVRLANVLFNPKSAIMYTVGLTSREGDLVQGGLRC